MLWYEVSIYIPNASAKCMFVKCKKLQMGKVNVILSRHKTELLPFLYFINS